MSQNSFIQAWLANQKNLVILEFFYFKLKQLLSPCIAGGFIKDATQTQQTSHLYSTSSKGLFATWIIFLRNSQKLRVSVIYSQEYMTFYDMKLFACIVYPVVLF